MAASRFVHAPRARRAPRVAWLAALLLVAAGCGEIAREADYYRLQQDVWAAQKASVAIQLPGEEPDSTELLALREQFIEAVDRAKVHPGPGPRSE
ncbi:MAG TPA: hypothetical protein VLT84_02085, partial [Acidobacteriota bacterium]|nr:hypothetical protein [Acidobacteriota bacterium]